MEAVADQVRAVLRRLAPALAVDGGGVELDRVEGDTAYIRLTGACIGCPGADITLQYGIESTLTEEVPAVARVVRISDAPAGPDEQAGHPGDTEPRS